VSNRSCYQVSSTRKTSQAPTYSVHTTNESEIGRGVVLRCEQETVSLSGSNVNQVGLRLVGINTINFNNSHVVALEPDVLPCESADIHHVNEIGLSWLDIDSEILGVIVQLEGQAQHQ
jgi:hypothetical protein